MFPDHQEKHTIVVIHLSKLRKLIFIFIIFSLTDSFGQVEIKGVLNFTAPNDSLRNVSNLSGADSLNQAVNAKDFHYNRYFESEISILNDTVFQIQPSYEFPNDYSAGMMILFKVPVLSDTINVPKYIKVGSLNIKQIKIINNYPFKNHIQTNRIIYLTYDGNSFILINSKTEDCPNNYKKMNENYCIQINRNSQTTFWNAIKICEDQGSHLCFFEEWYFACINNTGLINMPLNWEWVMTNSNHNVHALKIGNGGNCTTTDSETTQPGGLNQRYRCCYSLK